MTRHHEQHTHTRHRKTCRSGSGNSVAFLLLGMATGLAGTIVAMKLLANRKPKQVSIEDLRKAYAGLSPDEE